MDSKKRGKFDLIRQYICTSFNKQHKLFAFPFLIYSRRIVSNSFFREIRVIGIENIPLDAPVIICGNHNNQFLDGLVIGATASRFVRFIMAAASMRRPIQGAIGRFLESIPVERPRDLAKPGKGTVISIKEGILKGKDTEFLNQMRKGTQILCGKIKGQLKVVDILSDTELTYSTDLEEGPFEDVNEKYRICPDIDQSEMFGKVWSVLGKNQCVGIFPEGISHDGTDFMPIKAGICIIALGAMQKYRQKVYIVPCGLNYFKGHRFRSKVTVQYGQAFEIPFELVEMYKTNKKEAISTLLFEIENRMRSVVYTASTSTDLEAILLAKRLYFFSFHKRLVQEEKNILTDRFNSATQALATHPEMQQILVDCKIYNSTMTRLKLTDEETLYRFKQGVFKTILAIFYSIAHILISSSLAFPGLILNGPIGLVLRYMAERARKKEAMGWPSPCLDIVASQKVALGLMIFPITFWLYYLVFFFFLKNFILSTDQTNLLYFIQIMFVILYPIYLFLMLRLFDDIRKHFKAIRARIRFLKRNTELEQLEKSIETKIKDIVHTFCRQKEEGFDENYIIQPDNNSKTTETNPQIPTSRKDRFFIKLNRIKAAFSQPIKKIQEKLNHKKGYSDDLMDNIYKYLDKNGQTEITSSEQENDE